jgi:hypothetical protein
VDAYEPPSQLQGALKESTKVDAEYNLPTWVPKTRVNTTKRHTLGVDLRVHHVLPHVPHSAPIIMIINWGSEGGQRGVRGGSEGGQRGVRGGSEGGLRGV